MYHLILVMATVAVVPMEIGPSLDKPQQKDPARAAHFAYLFMKCVLLLFHLITRCYLLRGDFN